MQKRHESTRTYRKRRRARQEEETRRRITEAVIELHRTVGPANTQVTDVAKLAGVSRMTVYNHFPAEADLIEACSTHWAALHPFPNPAEWTSVEDPAEQLVTALTALYDWYAETQDMMGNVLRDAPVVKPLAAIMESRWHRYLENVVRTLARGWAGEGSVGEDVRAALRVAVAFPTWRVLSDSSPSRSGPARLAARMVRGVVPART